MEVGAQQQRKRVYRAALNRFGAAAVGVFVTFSILLSAGPALAQTILGKVVGITDGDTLTLLTNENLQVKIRLAEIDAPESSQPWGQKSKQMLSELAYGRQARAEVTDHDRYGRSVARVFVGSADVNLEMVRRGGAWAFRHYLTDDAILAAETSARSARRGLWAMPASQIVPPWEFRANKRAVSVSAAAVPPFSVSAATASVSCGAKRYCKQMSSCAEAKAYLHQCGVSSLDGDGDGVPCDAICRGR